MYPTDKIIPEMLGDCVPEVKGSHSSVMRKFIIELIKPYEIAVISAIWSGR